MIRKRDKKVVTNEKILKIVLDTNERMAAKDDLEHVRNELDRKIETVLEELEPIRKAVDKDAEMIVKHGKRITVLEQRVGVIIK
ncbi:hypothetical protein HY418_01855 [Candidatus Kaiserbacteria bacterium]|nr:hypothetical protein [Candidatus Kaiserbacteria bacterium]